MTSNLLEKFDARPAIIAILLLTVVSFWPSLTNDFVNWDDPIYIHNNTTVHELSWENTKKIFLTYVNGNYQPLTLFTFMFEYHFVKLSPMLYHLNNLLLHLCNVLLVYFLMKRLSRKKIVALLVMLLFAIHPMRVESVAWITERKDVLFAWFYILGLYTYLRYVDDHKKIFYFYALFCFILSLFAKPTAVTFPVLLFLIDYYRERKLSWAMFLEKIPLFVLSYVFGMIAIIGLSTPLQDVYFLPEAIKHYREGLHAPYIAESFSLVDRVVVFSYALAAYLMKAFHLGNLSCYYPTFQGVSNKLSSSMYVSPLICIAIMAFATRFAKAYKFFIFGILFFGITVFLNLPLKDMGFATLIADRFTYVPYIGFFFIMGEVLYLTLESSQWNKKYVLIFIVLIGFYLSYQSFERCKVWKNGETLWTDVIGQYPMVPLAYYNRGNYYYHHKEYAKAVMDYDYAIALKPDDYAAHVNRGLAHNKRGAYDLALRDYSKAIQMSPYRTKAYYHRWYLNFGLKNDQAAEADLATLLRLDPDNPRYLKLKEKTRKYYPEGHE